MPRQPLVVASAHHTAEPRGFTCLHAASDGEARVTVLGELDLATAPELDDTLRAAQRSATTVTLDLSKLLFMDVRGLRVVLDAAARAQELGERFLVVRGPPAVSRVFEFAATYTAIECIPDTRVRHLHAAGESGGVDG